MKERGMLFSAEMVRAILDGRKTQTRRVVVPQPETRRDLFPTEPENMMEDRASKNLVFAIRTGALSTRCLGTENFAREFCPFGQPGDRLWVRETWTINSIGYQAPPLYYSAEIGYRADDGEESFQCPGEFYAREIKRTRTLDWYPSIHMPRWASRLTLEITAVRVERLQDITPVDACAEAAHEILLTPDHPLRDAAYQRGSDFKGQRFAGARDAYAALWDSLNKKRGYGWDVNPWVWVIEFKRVEHLAVAA